VFEKLFDQGNIEFCLAGAYQQREADSPITNDGEVYLVDILEINEHVVYRGWEIGGNGWHKNSGHARTRGNARNLITQSSH